MSASIADDLIRSYFDRWQRLEEEKRTISDDLKELFAEARGNGLDTKALRAVFREQVGDKTARDEFDAICDLYRASLERPRARPAHSAREIIEEFDAETGEITEHEQPETVTQSTTKEGESDAKSAQVPAEHCDLIDRRRQDAERAGSQPPIPHQNAPAESATDAISAPLSPSDAASSDAATEPQAPQAVAAPIPEGIPAFLLKERKPLRPNCLHPDNCAGYGSHTCHSCTRAMAESEAA